MDIGREKTELIEAWRKIRNSEDKECFFCDPGLAHSIELVNRTWKLVKRLGITWAELEREADIDESDLAYMVRRSLYSLDVSITRANYVVVSVDNDEFLIECFQKKLEKAEAIAALLRVCVIFPDIQVMTTEEYLDVLDLPDVLPEDEEEMATRGFIK